MSKIIKSILLTAMVTTAMVSLPAFAKPPSDNGNGNGNGGGGGGGGGQPETFTSTTCGASTLTVGNAGYISCQGPVVGNIGPGGHSINTATFIVGTLPTTFEFAGKSDDAQSGPFTSHPGGVKSGTLTFDNVVTGYFVLGIKGGPDFSLYLFNGGTNGIKTLNFDTLGIAKGNGGAGPGLSHLALFTPVTPVPEPETYAMMLAGLGLMGTIARRRKANQTV